ncbi:MAG: helix-turn-helix domain-containing protein [Candidatus Pacearchaeota archaeon]
MDDIKEIFEEVGLSKKETEVYLALLKLGEETASRVSEVANLNRVTTYTLLKSLQEKGFCSVVVKNNIQFFRPIKPEQIVGLLEEKKNKIKAILPALKEAERAISEKPEVSLYEGKKGIAAMLELMLKESEKTKEVLAYGNLTIAEKVIEYETLYWRKTRLSKGIKMNAVVDSLKGFEPRKEKLWQKLSKWKENKELSKLSVFVMITDSLVSYTTFKGDLVAVVIRNKEIADKEKLNFEQLWRR